jgi:hypothetical protein
MSTKLTIAEQMRAFDSRNRDFYDRLDTDQRKQYSSFMMLKYGANVEGAPVLQEWYLRAHNERVNQNFFDIGTHPKLQWLLCTTVSPDMGNQRHYWLAPKKQSQTKAVKFLEKHFPLLNAYELEMLAEVNTHAQLVDMARSLGYDDRQIKDEL